MVEWNEESVAAVRWEAHGLARHFSDIRESHADYSQGRGAISTAAERYADGQVARPAKRTSPPGSQR